MSRPGLVLALVLGASVLAPHPLGAAPPTADLHQLPWFVHVDLIDAGAGTDLAYWQARIDEAMATATRLYEAGHGPFDTPCCTRIERSVPVVTFGTPGDGLDVLDSAAEYTTIGGTGLPGSRAFLVDSMTYCGGAAPSAIGCAQRPTCDGNPNDDPDLYMVVTVDALDSGDLGGVTAHERGHNACLPHVDVDECQIMRPAGGGGCVDATECANLSAGRNATGGVCSCHDGLGGIEPDRRSCNEITNGVCSGGVCGNDVSHAGVELLGAAGPENADGATPDDALRIAGLPGNWTDLGPLNGAGDVVEGLAWSTDAGILYGVVPTSGDDSVVTVDRATGDILATVGTIANGTDLLVALAYDPGATSATSDDRLLALESDGTFEDLVEIDPASPSSTTLIGPLAFGAANGFRGLAYDSANARIYTASPLVDGIYEIDTSTCGSFCGLNQLVGLGVARWDASLAYSSHTGRLYLVGTQSGVAPLGRRLLYNVIDPVAVTTGEEAGLDAFTPAALAALPLPAACADGVDNDGDGSTDFPSDPGCASAAGILEDPQCQDGIDNDGQVGTDFDGGESIHGVGNGDPNGADPQCTTATRNKEAANTGGGCGLGPELGLLLPLLGALRQRRARARARVTQP